MIRRQSRAALLIGAATALFGCASQIALTPEERGYLERAWTGRERDQYLKLSFYVTPFFGDGAKRLLTPIPPEEVRLLQTPGGQPISPGKVEKILPAGTPVRILRVEFPTAYVIPQRQLYTPRTRTWVFLQMVGEGSRPFIVVLRPDLKTAMEARQELERFLTPLDPRPLIAAYPPAVRDAVRRKDALEDMPADALERAWGYPERKQVRFAEESREEEWIYPGGTRHAFLKDDRVVRLEMPATPPPPP